MILINYMFYKIFDSLKYPIYSSIAHSLVFSYPKCGRTWIRYILTDAFKNDSKFIDLRSIAQNLSAEDTGILAQAKSIIDWNLNHKYCSKCSSSRLEIKDGVTKIARVLLKKPKIKSIADSPSETIDESIEKTLSETSKAV